MRTKVNGPSYGTLWISAVRPYPKNSRRCARAAAAPSASAAITRTVRSVGLRGTDGEYHPSRPCEPPRRVFTAFEESRVLRSALAAAEFFHLVVALGAQALAIAVVFLIELLAFGTFEHAARLRLIQH